MPFTTLKRIGAALLTPCSASPNSTTKETLFPIVTKEEDGEDCDHDCDACPGYPRAFEKIGIETSDKLWGGIKKYSTHVVVATGETDWIREVDHIEGSLMQMLSKHSNSVENGRMIVSASNLSPPYEYYVARDEGRPKPTTLIVLPAFVVLEDVTPNDAEAVIRHYINPGPTTSEPLPAAPPEPPTTDPGSESTVEAGEISEKLACLTLSGAPSPLRSLPYPHDYLVLICSHRRRDARCGISAPILRKEFEKHLRPLNLWRDLTDARPGGASVAFINHVGGHKYSANVIIYRKEDGQGIWLARVAPKHVEGIVKHTLVKGKIVHPDMIRGGFNRRMGLASW